MEMRKQGGSEAQGTARSASKSPAGRKQGSSAENEGATENQGTSMSQGAGQGTSASQGAGQGTSASQGAGQGTSMKQGAGQGTSSSNQGGSGQQAGGDQDLLEHAKHATGQIVNKVQEQAGTQINRQKETAATEISQVANAVRRIRENLPEQEIGPIARYVADYGDKAADGLDRLSNYIRRQDPKRLLDDVQNFGRRQPALLLGGAFLLGFAGARLIRSSIEAGSQHQQSYRTNVPKTTYPGANVSPARPSTTPSGL